MPSRDVFRLVHQVPAREGKPFIAVARQFYDDWTEHGADFSRAFLMRFDVELAKVRSRLDMADVPLSRVLGLVLKIVRGSELMV